VIARTSAVIEAGGVLGELCCTPPLTLRQVHSDAADRCELRLVGTAAGPLAGDDLRRATVHSVLTALGDLSPSGDSGPGPGLSRSIGTRRAAEWTRGPRTVR